MRESPLECTSTRGDQQRTEFYRILTNRLISTLWLLSYFFPGRKVIATLAVAVSWHLVGPQLWGCRHHLRQSAGTQPVFLRIPCWLIHASWTERVRASWVLLESWCFFSTADCKLIPSPRSRAFNSGDLGGCHFITILWFSNSCHHALHRDHHCPPQLLL